MMLLSKRTMANEVAKNMHNGKWVAKHRKQWQMWVESRKIMTNDDAKHKNNANEAAKQNIDDK